MTVNDEYVGITPVVVPLTRSEMRPYRWRAEKEGYEPQEGVMQPRVATGRIFGYIFTLGLLAILKGPRYMPDLMVDLKPLPASGVTGGGDGQSVEERLQHAEGMRSRGLISDAEYQKLRAAILADFGDQH